MKLALCSEGFATPNTVKACVDLCDKPQDQISIAVINEAYAYEAGDKYWVVHGLQRVAQNFPGGLDLVNLLALPLDEVRARIEERDAIFTIGGNPDYLMHIFMRTGFSEILPELLQKKVYVGSSAGSMVLGRRMPTEAYKTIYGECRTFGIADYLKVVDYACIPHLYSNEFPNNTPEELLRISSDVDFPLHALQDDGAIIEDGHEQRYIGSKPFTIVRDN